MAKFNRVDSDVDHTECQPLEASGSGAWFYAPRDYYDAVRRLQRAQLLDDQEPEDDSGPDRAEEVLQALQETHAA
jgi:hypothetical protein